ncbi:hypothetical protein BDU57DRAFT_445928 [Ampelomyces quisqualis]|uniref:Uncharacterized protein n=1 Tax=Ampelomyces quisqualis TaxID=50730 RepID=A0A6A5QRG6_AMPQU|nr:hypothetical protein BDU57DRAFT_445928 [Ampelomyces quisqualis]
MAVLERVRQEHGNPVLSDEEKRMWRQVRRGVEYALGKSKGRMPREVESRVKYVCEKVGKGTWGLVMDGAREGEGNGKGEAARANDDAARVYGGGLGAHHGGVQRGVIAPPNSPGVGHEMPFLGVAQRCGAPVQQFAQSHAAPQMGYIPPPPQQQQQQPIGAGYAQTQSVGGRGAGGYPQSMGGSWV